MREKKEDQQYTLLGSGPEADGESTGTGTANLEQYCYFDAKQIASSLKVPQLSKKEGARILKANELQDIQVSSGYENYWLDRGMIGEITAYGGTKKPYFQITLAFDRTHITEFSCGCPKCRKRRYSWYAAEQMEGCGYAAALLEVLENYLSTHNIGDATELRARKLMSAYRRKHTNLVIADKTAKEGSVELVPRLVKKNGQLAVSFKIGTGRLFVIKKLDEFCTNVRSSATGTYGSDTEINHHIANFTERGKGWIRFIQHIVQEEIEFSERLEAASRRYYYHRTVNVGGSLNLFGWRLDEFYRELGNQTVEYEDRDAEKKVKGVLHCGDGNPTVTMRISELNVGKDTRKGEFHGIQVSGRLPELFFGTDRAYYVSGNCLCRTDSEFQDKIMTLAAYGQDDGSFSFKIGRNGLSEFYYQFLPQLQDVLEISEENPERFRSYLPPKVSFAFYLDAEESDVTCKVRARYGEKDFSALDVLSEARRSSLERYRDMPTEQETLQQVQEWLPVADLKHDELNCGGDEEQMYRMMAEGVDALLGLGEVHCTNRFRSRQQVRSMKVSVGVSVSSGLLNLDITTEDIPQEELLDILAGYRAKKRYYRLKDGAFVDLQDSSIEMLSELMDSLHMKPKEFVKGKMQLPLYRTLYLNKMLEENDHVYSSRDSRFRELVKGFKTVNDADFEVPGSLAHIMRKYQKNGYKWLRTLESWGFGGILADDMGLGKTLQMIAVLLAAKEEGKTGTSLIVAPASLVFNWGEEFARFAPALSVLPVTGTQEERSEKVASWENYDVLVTSYDLLKRDIALYEGKQFAYEVIDEAQYIKNHTTAAAKAVKVVKSSCRFALTGTPIENRLSELWSIFDYLMPGFLYTYESFKREMETPIVKNQDEQAMQRLQKITGPFILRRLKEDVLKDLPQKLEEVRYVRLGDEQQKLYDGQVLHMRAGIEGQNEEDFNKNKLRILAELTRLRQICCDPALCFENYRGEAAKVEACAELVKSALDGGHRMLLFSQFTSMLEILQKRFDEEGIDYYTITGATPKETRLSLVKQFNSGNVPVFLISLKAGGVGLNLTGADVVIHYDPWWNVAAQNQATDRTHRIGQTKKVTVYKLIVKNSVEEKILKLQETKKDLADQVIGGDAAQLGSMSREELLELLGV